MIFAFGLNNNLINVEQEKQGMENNMILVIPHVCIKAWWRIHFEMELEAFYGHKFLITFIPEVYTKFICLIILFLLDSFNKRIKVPLFLPIVLPQFYFMLCVLFGWMNAILWEFVNLVCIFVCVPLCIKLGY